MLKQHENFETANSSGAFKWVVRQERFELADDSTDIQIGNNTYRIVNYSATGLAIVSDAKLTIEKCEVNVRFMGNSLARLAATLIRSIQVNGGKYVTSLEFKHDLFPIDQLNGLYIAQNVLSQYSGHLAPKVSKGVLHQVLIIKDFLETAEKACSEIENDLKKNNESHHLYEEVEKSIVENIYQMLAQQIDDSFTKLVDAIPSSESEKNACYEYIREKLGHILLRAAFANRAYSKPLGYAGDYQMMNMIYHRGKDGASNLFTKCLNQYFLTRPASVAVKNRSFYLKRKLMDLVTKTRDSGQKLRILSLASGPAQEVILALKEMTKADAERIELWLVDQDIESLRYAQRDLRRTTMELDLNPKIYFENMAIKNVLKEGFPVENLDLIYSAGLFDYFTDPVVVMSAQLIIKYLKPGGTAIIGNFDSNNPSRSMMEAVLDWNLIHRTEAEMLGLFSQATKKVKVEKEESKINLFVVMEK